MENKLQHLTQKLYNEGLEKGRVEADRLVEQANAQAAKILREATAKAEKIVADATTKAEELTRNTRSEVVLASRQSLAALKEQIQTMVSTGALAGPLGELSLDADFLGELLAEVVKKWDAAIVTLPEKLEQKFQQAVKGSLGAILGKRVELRYASGLESGFTIEPDRGGYRIDFTDKDFRALVGNFLRPKVAQLLWDEPDESPAK